MAKQKKINKNLVAFLTVMGILLSVSLVAVITVQGSQKDPLKVAETARQYEQKGELDRAIEYYMRAYDASRRKGSPDVQYYIAASKCAYSLGKLNDSLMLLARANTQAPTDKTVLTAMVERLWELNKLGARLAPDMRDYSEKLLKLEPDNLLALLCSSVALDELGGSDAALKTQAQERLARAVELAPNDPRVVITRVQQLIREANVIARRAGGRMSPADQEEFNKLRDQAMQIVASGAEKHPDDPQLIAEQAQMLAAQDRWEDALKIVESGVKAAPQSADMQAGLGRLLTTYVAVTDVSDKPLAPERRKELLDRATIASSKARELEPAMFEAYFDLARVQLLSKDATADPAADAMRRYKAALEVYDQAIKSTIGAKSVRALNAAEGRRTLMKMAFDVAREMHGAAADDESRRFALERCRKYAEDSLAQFREHPVTHLTQGQLAMMTKELRKAIQSYLEAERLSRNNNAVNREANAYLALLYHDLGEIGTSGKYLETALSQYGDAQPPVMLRVLQVDALARGGKEQQAIDLLKNLDALPEYKDDPALKRMYIAVLAQRKDPQAAREAEAFGAADDVEAVLLRARVALTQQDWQAAESGFAAALSREPERPEALRQYVQLMMRNGKQAAAQEFLASIKPKIKDKDIQRRLEGFDILLSSKDEDEKNRRLLEAIEKITDEFERAQELAVYHLQLNDLEKTAVALDAAEKLKPDDTAILDLQFTVALQRKQFDRAAGYSVKLAAKNGDSAGGALYRGRLALARATTAADDPYRESAIREFRAALQKLPGSSTVLCQLALAQSSKPEEAIITLNEAIASNPNSLPALKMLHELHSRRGERERAHDYLRRAAKLAPTDPYIARHAETLAEEENPQEGIRKREQARAQEPNNAENLLRLAELYLMLQPPNRERAAEALEAAAVAAPSSVDVLEMVPTLFADRALRERGEKIIRGYIDAQTEGQKVYGYFALARYYLHLGEKELAFKTLADLPRLCDELITDQSVRHIMHLESATELGNRYSQVGETSLAVDAYKKALSLVQPDDRPEIRQRLRMKLLETLVLKREFYAELARELDSYLKDFPKDIDGLRVRMRQQIAEGKFEQARDTLNDILLQRPKDVMTLSMRGLVNFRLKLYPQALKDFQEAKALTQPGPGEPLSPVGQVVRLRLANLYEQDESQIDLAIATHRELVNGPPINHEAAANLIRIYKTYRRPEDADKLIAEYEQKQPQSPFWPMQLGFLQLERGQAGTAAVQFQRAFDLSGKKDAVAWAQAVYAKAKGGAAAEAARLYESTPAELLTPRVRIAGAWAYQFAKDEAKAALTLEEALGQAAREGLPQLIQTVQLMAENREWAAVAALCEKVLASSAGSEPQVATRLRMATAMALMSTPQAARAPELIQPLISSLTPGSEDWYRAQMIAAQGYMVSGKIPESTAVYETILKQNEGHIEALNNLAYFKAEAGDLAEAEKYADRLALIDMDSQNPNDAANTMDTIGYVYMKKGRQPEAENWLRDALRLSPSNVPARIHLAELLISQGKQDEARPLLERAIKDADKQNDAANLKRARDLLSSAGGVSRAE